MPRARSGLYHNVAKFGKLGGKASLIDKIYTSSKNWNYILTKILSLSNHWPSGKSIPLKGIYRKITTNWHCPHYSLIVHKTWWSRIKTNSDSLISWTIFHHHCHQLFKDQHFIFSHILHSEDGTIPTFYPVTEDEFGHTVVPDPFFFCIHIAHPCSTLPANFSWQLVMV